MTPLPEIVAAVSERFVVTPDEIMGTSHASRFTLPRHVVCYVARKTGHKFFDIAHAINHDHSTVCYGAKRISDDMELYPHIARAVADVRQRLENGQWPS